MRPLSLFSLAVAATLVGTASAQLATPKFANTFNNGARSRGFSFQVPANTVLIVVHAQVPDEPAAGNQAVALYKMAAKPPAYPGTVPGNPVWFGTGKSSDRLAVVPPQTFKAGEWLCVIGITGSATTANNSYGSAGCLSTLVLGKTTQMCRLLTQTNIFANSGVGALSSEDGGAIARVRLWVAGGPSAIPFGKSKRGALVPCDPFPPSINTSGKYLVMPGTGSNNGAVMLLGAARQTPPIPTPYGDLNIRLPFFVLGALPPIPATGSTVSLPLPNDKNLLGLLLAWQLGIIEATANPAVQLTNGLEWILGN
jgi:hypothetical protein